MYCHLDTLNTPRLPEELNDKLKKEVILSAGKKFDVKQLTKNGQMNSQTDVENWGGQYIDQSID